MRIWTITKFTLFYKTSCVLVASVMTRLIKFAFKNLINVGGRLRSGNLVGMITCFLSSMVCTNCFGQNEVRFSWRNLSRRGLSLVPNTVISLIRESWRLSKSYSELNFLNSVTKSWTFWRVVCIWKIFGEEWLCFSKGCSILKICGEQELI